MTEPRTLVLQETGIARHRDGNEAVNVGPIVAALSFLTEGRGEDRGLDERGQPLPDLLSLAFDVVQSIILGGRQADYFRKVKQELDDQPGFDGRRSLGLAKQAAKVRPRTPSTALEKAAKDLRAQIEKVDQVALADEDASELRQAIDDFREFGADRWVAATSHLLLALNVLGHARPRGRTKRRAKRRPPAPEPRTAKRKSKKTKAAPAKAARKPAKPKPAKAKPAKASRAAKKKRKRR